jgi:hypothetical protein
MCIAVDLCISMYLQVSSLPVGYRISILAASLLVVLLPAGLIAHHKAQRRRREEEALRAMNASSLSRQRKVCPCTLRSELYRQLWVFKSVSGL